MKTFFQLASAAGLGLTIVPAFLVLFGVLSWEAHALLMLVGTLFWFASAPFWMTQTSE